MSQQTSTKILQKIAFVVVAIAIAMVLYISYLLFTPANVIEVKRQPLPTEPTVVHPGDVIFLTFDYCKHRNIASHIQLDFEGDYIVPSLSTIRHFPVGCHVVRVPFTMPLSSQPGTYKVLLSINYQINNLKSEHYEFRSQTIKVIK